MAHADPWQVVPRQVQVNLIIIIMLSFRSIEADRVISETML